MTEQERDFPIGPSNSEIDTLKQKNLPYFARGGYLAQFIPYAKNG
jgi:hypothetical protein